MGSTILASSASPRRPPSPKLRRVIPVPRFPWACDSGKAEDGEEPEDQETDATGRPLGFVPLTEVMAEELVYDRLVARQRLTGDPLAGYRAAGKGDGNRGKDGADKGWSCSPLFPARYRPKPSGEFHADLVPATGDGQVKRDLERAVLTAAVLANQLDAGCVPGFVQEFLEVRLKDVPPWSRALRRWLNECNREHRCWTRLHRRSAFLPCPAPGKRRDPELVGVVLDTSGSMSSPVLADVLGELRALALAQRLALVVWQADTRVYGPELYERPEELPLKWKLWGRGGTMMTDAAEAVRRRGLRLTLWVTDGWWFDSPKLPESRNVAVLVGLGRPPEGVVFDEIIQVDADG